MGLTGVNLGAAYAQVLVDYSQMEQDANRAFQRVEQGLTDKLNNMGQKMMLVGRNLDLLLSPVQKFVQQGVFAFANFDEVMTEIAARTGATADEMERVKAVSLEMGKNTQFSATEASQAMLEMLSSGSSLEEAIAALPDVLNLASVGTITLGESADSVTDILAQFQKDISHSGEVVDALSAASQKSSATVPDLIAAFANVGPIANAFNLSIEDTAAVLAVFAESGIKGAEAGTQLKSMLNHMAQDTDTVKGAWEELGTSLFDAEGNMRNLDDVIDDINTALADKTPEERQRIIADLAGTYGQMGLEALLAADGIDAMQDSMDEAADASDLAKQKMNSWKGIVNQVKSSIETLSITVIGPLVEDYLKPLAKHLIDVINVINQWMVDNPELAKQIGVLLGVLSLLGPVIFSIGTAIVLMSTPMGEAAVSAGVMSLGIIGIVLALGALWIAYKQNFMGFADGVDKAFADLKPTLEAVADWFMALVDAFQTGGMQGAFDFLTAEFERLQNILSAVDWQGLAGQGAGLLAGLWESFKPQASEAIDMAKAWLNEHVVQPVVDYIKAIDWVTLATNAGNATLNFLGKLWEWLKPRGQAALEFAGNWLNEHVVQPVVDYIKAIDWGQVAGDTVDFLKGLLDWLVTQGTAGANIAADWLNEHVIQPIVEYVKNINWGQVAGEGIDFVGGLLEWLGEATVNVAGWVNDHILQPILDSLGFGGDQQTEAGNFLGKIWDAIASGTVEALTWVKDHIYDPIVAALGEVDLGTVGDFLEHVFDAIATCVVDAADWINENIISPLSDGLDEVNWEEIGCFIGEIFDAAADFVINYYTWLWDNIVKPIVDEIGKVNWGEALGDYADLIGTLLSTWADAAVDFYKWLYENVITPLVDEIGEIDWGEVLGDSVNIIEDILNFYADTYSDIGTWVYDNIFKPIGDAIGGAGDWITQALSGGNFDNGPIQESNVVNGVPQRMGPGWPGPGGEGDQQGPLALATEEQIQELDDLKAWFDDNSSKVVEKLDAMKAAAQFMIDTLTDLTIGGVDRLNIWRDGFKDILPGIMNFRDAFTETILSAVEPVNVLSDAVKILSQRLYDLSLHNTITVAVTGNVDVPPPARAGGGHIGADVVFLGAEKQQGELFVSDRSGMVVNNDQLQTAINALSGGNGGGDTLNIYIDGSTIRDEDTARRNGTYFGQQFLEAMRST